MMQRIWQFLTSTRTLVFIGFAALAAFLLIGASSLEIGAIWVGILLGIALIVWLLAILYRRWKAKREAESLGNMLQQQTNQAQNPASGLKSSEVETIRKRMLEAITTIKTSKLGLMSGSAALYELPWYMIIGNPAAGKSTAIANSGLQFPFADKNGKVVQGIGGTRNCDWFFTTDGIILDTAGRYAVHEEDREEWFGFLSLLKNTGNWLLLMALLSQSALQNLLIIVQSLVSISQRTCASACKSSLKNWKYLHRSILFLLKQI